MKRSLGLLLAGALMFNAVPLSSLASPIVEENVKESAARNTEELLSQGKPVTVSRTEYPNNLPEKAVDGDGNTRWATASYKKYAGYPTVPDLNWIAVDLGQVSDITRLYLKWEGAIAKKWRLQVSDDGGSYMDAYSGTTERAGVQEITFPESVRGRYVRLYADNLYNIEWGCSLFEFQVYGTPTQETGKDAFKLTTEGDGVQWFLDENGGWVNGTDEVKVYVIPKDGNELTALTANGADVLGSWNSETKLLTLDSVTGDTKLRAEANNEPDTKSRRREAETAECGSANKWSVNKNSQASGGAVAGSTGNKAFIFRNLPESNKIAMKYAAPSSGSVYVDVLIGSEWESAGAITFATTQSWDMASGNVVTSEGIYIPEGASVRITPAQDVDLDYFEFLSGPLNEEKDLAAGVVLAKKSEISSGETVNDIMSLTGETVKLPKGASVTFTVPDIADLNTYTLGYRAEADAKVSVKVGEAAAEELLLTKTQNFYYGTKGKMDVGGLTAGAKVTVTLTEGEAIYADYLEFRSAPASQGALEISADVAEGARETICMDGVWSCTSTKAVSDPKTASIPTVFDNTIPVPGLWTSASFDMGPFAASSLWYHKNIILPENFDPNGDLTATLQILRAEYGRSVYVNGQYVDSYPYNFTNSAMDITSYLKGGKNDIVIMLGNLNDQKRDPNNVAHTGTDIERSQYEPGFTDSVNLILNRQPAITSVQTASNLEEGSAKVRVKLANASDMQKNTDVKIQIYELGIIKNGEASMRRKVGAHEEKSVAVDANGTAQVDIASVKIDAFDMSKAWEPGNPYLYELEVQTSGDTYSRRFGMRSFEFDRETNEPMLNGKIHRLLGTNVAVGRFYEDPNRGTLPWQEEWVRTLYSEFQDTNWEIFRTHNCPLPSFWYDLADEMGMMIVDEYAIWYCNDAHKCTTESMLPEYKAMVDEKQTHPSIVWWDAQNETTGVPATAECAKIIMDEGYDIADRYWDNGWSKPVDQYQPVEYHPYPFWNVGKNLDTLNITNDQVPFNGGENSGTIPNPKIINEYASLWVNREGEATYISKDNFEYLLPKDATNEDRREFYNRSVAYSTEFWRAGRNIAGIQQFTGLSYSKPGSTGATSDVLMPDIATPKVWDSIQARLKDSFNRLGIGIKLYDVETGPGESYSFPVSVYNDLNEDVNDLPVTLKVTAGGRVLHSETKVYNVSEATAKGADGTSPDTMVQEFSYTMPENGIPEGTEVKVTASYSRNGETVSSIREMTWNQTPKLKLKATAGSSQNGQGPEKAVDNDEKSIWHTVWNGGVRENMWIDLHIENGPADINTFRYLPRDPGKDGRDNNGTIKKYRLEISRDNGKNYEVLKEGEFTSEYGWKEVSFETQTVTNIRLYAVESVGNYASAAEVACIRAEEGKTEEVRAEGIALNNSEVELDLKSGPLGAQLIPTVTPSNASDQTVTWESSDAEVAQVNETGYVTAVGIGTALITVTAKDGEWTASCLVSVTGDESTAEVEAAAKAAKEAAEAAEKAAGNAADAKSVAEKAAQAAQAAQENAKKAAQTAGENSAAAVQAKNAAFEAQNKAEKAWELAVDAQTAAEKAAQAAADAQTAAEEARNGAEGALKKAETARDAALQAQQSAEQSKDAAEKSAESAEEYANLAGAAKDIAEAARDEAVKAQAAAKKAQEIAEEKAAEAERAIQEAQKLKKEMEEILSRVKFEYAKAAIKTAKSPKRGQVKISWKKVEGAEGYVIQYATKSNFKGKKTVTVKSGKVTGTTIRKLKRGKKYYFRIRAYRIADGERIYTSFSAKKTVKKVK